MFGLVGSNGSIAAPPSARLTRVLRSVTVSRGSSGDGNSQELRCPDFLGDRLTVCLQARDVDLDGLHGALAALLNRAAPGKAPRQGRHGHEVAAVRLGLH